MTSSVTAFISAELPSSCKKILPYAHCKMSVEPFLLNTSERSEWQRQSVFHDNGANRSVAEVAQ